MEPSVLVQIFFWSKFFVVQICMSHQKIRSKLIIPIKHNLKTLCTEDKGKFRRKYQGDVNSNINFSISFQESLALRFYCKWGIMGGRDKICTFLMLLRFDTRATNYGMFFDILLLCSVLFNLILLIWLLTR